ncbi:hypothetical protein, partial [Winogradskyella sp.]|uniref:hypothetical protein n=1 Tax=Winogradskyella sp. TaxID=1883156 RepID=UPI0025CCD781
MKRIGLFIILCLWFTTKVRAQDTLVPMRVKDKYGLSNFDKDIKVKPIYDKVNFSSRPHYFIGFTKKKNNRFVTSLLYKDQVIIKNKPYFDYSIYDNLIIGADTTFQKTIKYHSIFYNEKMQLYTK